MPLRAFTGVFTPPLHGKQHQPGGDHGAAEHAADEVQPAHRVTAELRKVQAKHHPLRQHTGAQLRRPGQQLTGNTVKHHVVAFGQGNTVTQHPAHFYMRITAAGVLDHHTAQRPHACFGLGQ